MKEQLKFEILKSLNCTYLKRLITIFSTHFRPASLHTVYKSKVLQIILSFFIFPKIKPRFTKRWQLFSPYFKIFKISKTRARNNKCFHSNKPITNVSVLLLETSFSISSEPDSVLFLLKNNRITDWCIAEFNKTAKNWNFHSPIASWLLLITGIKPNNWQLQSVALKY